MTYEKHFKDHLTTQQGKWKKSFMLVKRHVLIHHFIIGCLISLPPWVEEYVLGKYMLLLNGFYHVVNFTRAVSPTCEFSTMHSG